MASILSTLNVRELEGAFRQLIESFFFHDKLIGIASAQAGFICDYESVPLIRGTSKRAGVIHDYFYRFDSKPVVNKETADKLYLKFMKSLGVGFTKRWGKYLAVKWFGASSFHKLSINATLEEIKACRQ